jgi:outer membrane receptor for ferrienterochelin and colicins
MRTSFCSIPVLAVLLLLPAVAAAQQGVIVARATDAATARPLPLVQVSVVGGGTSRVGLTGEAGRVPLQVPDGTYTVRFELIGRESATVEGVDVVSGQSVDVSVSLEESAIALSPLVITSSRRLEKKTDAPATTHVVTARTVSERPSMTPVDYLSGTPGVDVIRQGIQATNVVVRGFNNVFSGALHTLTDNRIAGVPSLRVNLLHFVPANDDDVARVETVLGPGSALYGPNTANGVVHIITKSPLSEQGTTASIAGGERGVFKGMFRTSHVLGDGNAFGIKLSGQVMRGRDWPYHDPAELAARNKAAEDPGGFHAALLAQGYSEGEADLAFDRIGVRDFDFLRFGAEVRADWRMNDAATWIFQAGLTSSDGIELTGLGAGQTDDWIYSYYQTRFSSDRLFAQVYLNRSNAGDTYLIRRGVPLADNSNLVVGQVQHGLTLGGRMEDGSPRQDLTYGIDVFLTTPQTKGTINGKYEDDDQIDEVGAYVQSETALLERLDLILAARVDKSSILDDAVFSPRAALVFEAWPEQSFRATYNRAFSTPTTLNYFLDINGGLADFAGNPGFFQRAVGPGPDGISFQDPDGSLRGVRSPFTPSALGGPGQLLAADPVALWPLLVGAGVGAGRITPQDAQILLGADPEGVGINLLDPATFAVTPAEQADLLAAPRLRESTTETFEVGYQGNLDGRVSIAADAWYSKLKNFTSPLLIQTPLVLLDGADIAARYVAAGGSPANAAAVAEALGSLPVGVVSSPDVVTETADIVVTYRNYGRMDLFGWDVAVRALLTERWTVEGSASWMENDFFVIRGDEEVDDPGTITDTNEIVSLNAPDFKTTLGLGYRDGVLTAEGRVRHTSQFPVASADYKGLRCVPGLVVLGTLRDCVASATLVDLLLGYRIPGTGAEIQLQVSNLFDEPYRSFVGVPDIGRLALLQLKYVF